MTLPALATIDDLAAVIGTTVADLDPERAAILLELASDLIRDEVHQRFDLVEDDVIEVPGSGTAILVLPELPVVDVTAVVLVGEFGEADETLTASPATDAGYRAELGADGRQGILRRFGLWPRRSLVRITYSHGYAETAYPASIRSTVARAAARGWVSAPGVRQETIGRYSVTYGEAGLFLTDYDRAVIGRYYPGSRAGAR